MKRPRPAWELRAEARALARDRLIKAAFFLTEKPSKENDAQAMIFAALAIMAIADGSEPGADDLAYKFVYDMKQAREQKEGAVADEKCTEKATVHLWIEGSVLPDPVAGQCDGDRHFCRKHWNELQAAREILVNGGAVENPKHTIYIPFSGQKTIPEFAKTVAQALSRYPGRRIKRVGVEELKCNPPKPMALVVMLEPEE